MIRPAGLLAAAALCACSSSAPPAPVAPAAKGDGAGSGAPGAEATIDCKLTVREEQVERIELRSADSRCRLILPLAVAPGKLPLRVGAAPGEPAASFEARNGEETFYASEGEVELLSADGGGLRGRLEGRDANPPGLARLTATFSIAGSLR